jgi:hypothetical protein
MKGQDRIPKREQDVVDLCRKWAAGDSAKAAAFGWDQDEVTAVLGLIHAFRSAYKADNSTAKAGLV